MKFLIFFTAALLPLAAMAVPERLQIADFGARGDGITDDGAAFARALTALAAAPGTTLELAPKVYKIGSQNEPFIHERYHLTARSLDGNTIAGNGGTLLFANPDHGGILFRDCRNLQLQDVSFDWDPLPFTQGVITAVDPQNPRSFTLKIEPGYPEADNGNFQNTLTAGKFMIGFVYDPETCKLFTGKLFDNHKSVRSVQKLRPGQYQICLKDVSRPDAVVPGRLFVLLSRNPSNGIVFDNCLQPTVRHVTMYSSSHIGMVFRAGTTAATTEAVQLIRKPGTTRMLCTNADGLFFDGCPQGPQVRNCRLDGVMDDGIVLPVNSRLILEVVDPQTFKVKCTWRTLIRPGDHLEAITPDGQRSGALPPVIAVSPDAIGEINGQKQHYEIIRLQQPSVKLDAGDQLFNLDMANADFMVCGNTIANLRGKGIKIHGNGGVAKDNTIDRCTFGAIEIGYQYANGIWSFMWAENVMIKDNRINGGALLGLIQPTPIGWSTAIRVHQGPDDFKGRPNRNIQIIGNTIVDSGQTAIRAWATQDLEITSNQIKNYNFWRLASDTMAIELINVGPAEVKDNIVTGNNDGVIVQISPDSGPATVEGNRHLNFA